MPLLSLWSSNPAAITAFTIEQVVATAGDGNLRDGSECSREFRQYLSEIPSPKLAEYVDRCLTAHFPKAGMVLQDVINELGRRLDYTVTNGRYQGTSNAIGFDGVWLSPEGHSIVVEVKTTDAYRISLDTIASYRERLLNSGQIAPLSSILIVVGREDTGELEAQVRGSRHAWDMRLISADALIKLVQLKEDSEAPETGRKIRSLLTPMEYTRLDQMIDVMFTTAKDVESAAEVETGQKDEPSSVAVPEAKSGAKVKGVWKFTDSVSLQTKREAIVAALENREGTKLIKKSRALYWDPSHSLRAVFTISKRYPDPNASAYWHAYHVPWDAFLGDGERSFLVLGCMDRDEAFAIPLPVMRSLLDALHTTERPDGTRYWHLYLDEAADDGIELRLPRRRSALALSQYRLPLPTSDSDRPRPGGDGSTWPPHAS